MRRTVAALSAVVLFRRDTGRRARRQVDYLDEYNVLAYLLHALPRHEKILRFRKKPAFAVRQDNTAYLPALGRKNYVDDMSEPPPVDAVDDLAAAKLAIG